MQIDEARAFFAALTERVGWRDFDQSHIVDDGDSPASGHVFKYEVRTGGQCLFTTVQTRKDFTILNFNYRPPASTLDRRAAAFISCSEGIWRLEIKKESWANIDLLYGVRLVYSGREPDTVEESGAYAFRKRMAKRGDIHTILDSVPILQKPIAPEPDFMSEIVAATIEWVMPRGHEGIVVPEGMKRTTEATLKPFAPDAVIQMFLSAQAIAREAGSSPAELLGWNLGSLGLQTPNLAMISAATMMNFAFPRCS